MGKLRHSIVMRLVIVSTLIIMVLCTTIFTIQSQQQQKMYMDFFEQRLTLLVDMEIQDLRVQSRSANLTMDDTKNANADLSSNMNIMQIRYKLNALLKDDMKAMYILSTRAPASTDEGPVMSLIQGNDTIEERGFKPGDLFPMDHGKLEAVESLKTAPAASTSNYVSNEVMLLSTFVPITNEQGEAIAYLGVDFDYSIIDAKLNEMLWSGVSIGLLIEIAGILFLIWFVRYQLRMLPRVQKIAMQAADGDLTVRLQVKGKDEISKMAFTFNQMIERLSSLLYEVQSASRGVSQSTVELGRGAEETASSAAEVSASMQQVASGAQMQLQNAEETRQAMLEITIGAQQVSESSTHVLNKMDASASMAEEGRKVIGETVSQMERIQEASELTYESLSRLSHEVEEISQAVRFIQGVVKQTELLALNASIEAARAGEHGKGFQVVAVEVRKLSEHSKTSLNHIMELIEQVYAHKTKTERAAMNQKESVAHGLDIVRVADEAFQQIANAVNDMSEQVRDGSVTSVQMSAASEEVLASIEQLSQIANQSRESSERVAAATEEQSAMTEQIRASVDQLHALSQQLEKQISQFKVLESDKEE